MGHLNRVGRIRIGANPQYACVITGKEETVGAGLRRRQDAAHPAAVVVAAVAIKPASQCCACVPARCKSCSIR